MPSRLKLGRRQVVILNHPELIAQVFDDDAGRLRSATFAEESAARVGGVSLPLVTGEEHAARRRVVEGVFDRDRLGAYVDPLLAEIRAATSEWQDGRTVDLVHEFEHVQTRALGRATFGNSYDPGSPELHGYLAVSRQIVPRFVNPLASLLWRAPLPLTRRFERSQAAFNEAVGRFVEERHRDRGHDDLLARLLQASRNGRQLTDTEARDEAWSYFSQGVMVYVLSWAFSLLARHPEVEARLHEEVDGTPAAAAAAELPVTLAVVRETVRLYPPGWLIVREAAGDYELAGRTFPAGTRLVVSPYALHRDERFWPRPEQFDPDRFLRKESGTPPAAFIAFGVGPRRCPARSFAELTLVLAVAHVARHWRLHAPANEPRRGYLPFLRPKGALRTRLERRERRRGGS